MNNNPIGFFDSGVGGLSVYARFREILPHENTIYYGDLKNLPYGSKTKEQLVGYARNILDFFKTKNVKAVVIACNTSSALAYEIVKNEYDFEIYPIIQSCAKMISTMNDAQRIGVFATEGTVKSGAYKAEILKYNPEILIKEFACPNWVSIVETTNKDEDYANDDIKKHMLEMLEFRPNKIILGCTHYPYLIKYLSQYAPKEIFLDPAEIFVKYISENINKSTQDNVGSEEFYVSANPIDFVRNSKLFYDIKELPNVI
ncbi:MAG: glutamate racemase [Cyanobacteria bacterium SIG31]|nr:glutamate racemase [Cyanobacteria bacterium SIG31]